MAAQLLAFVVPLGCAGIDGATDDPSELEQGSQAIRVAPSVLPSWDRSDVPTNGGCTATLIHPRFVISAAHCVNYPVSDTAPHLVFYDGSGKAMNNAYRLDHSWILPAWLTSNRNLPKQMNFTQYGTTAVLNSDLWLARIDTSAPAGVRPATIATKFPADGTTVSSHGFGDYGTDCSSPADGNKRSLNFSWGSSYPVCSGDSGGPTFDAAYPGGNLLTATGSEDGSASVVHFREEIYERMRLAINHPSAPDRWLVGTKREGTVLTNGTTTVSGPADCETACIKDSACQAWSLTGSTCSLKGYVGRWLADANSTSGIRPVTEVGRDRSGGTLLSEVSAVSASHCAGLCGQNSSCKAYTFNSTGNKCKLLSSVVTGTTVATATSGVRQSQESTVNRPGSEIPNDPIASTAKTASACADACARHQECQAYTFNTSSTSCQLKYVMGTPADGSSSSISGIKRRPLANVSVEGAAIDGKKDIVTPQRTVDACRALCDGTASCVAYRVSMPGYGRPMKCTLLKTVTGERVFGDIVSGYKGLTFF